MDRESFWPPPVLLIIHYFNQSFPDFDFFLSNKCPEEWGIGIVHEPALVKLFLIYYPILQKKISVTGLIEKTIKKTTDKTHWEWNKKQQSQIILSILLLNTGNNNALLQFCSLFVINLMFWDFGEIAEMKSTTMLTCTKWSRLCLCSKKHNIPKLLTLLMKNEYIANLEKRIRYVSTLWPKFL